MKHLLRPRISALVALIGAILMGCDNPTDTTGTSAAVSGEAPARVSDVPFAVADQPVTITQAPGAALFVDDQTAQHILRDLEGYFASQNAGDFATTMTYYPLYRANMDSAMIAQSVEQMNAFWDQGVRNQTEAADVLYMSNAYRDGDQDVVLLNMDLVHRVIFLDYEGTMSPKGMKGMVESSYGKGNAQFNSLDTNPKVEYWEVRGDNRLWAVRQVDTDRWCFLPANFNERGGGAFMTVDAMTSLLRHRSDNDPFRLQ